jgi:hypothetical protein
MSNITDVIEYLIKQGRKDYADVAIRELKGTTIVHNNPAPIQPLTIPKIGQPPYAEYETIYKGP